MKSLAESPPRACSWNLAPPRALELPFTSDTRTQWRLTLATGALAMLLIVLKRLRFPPEDAWQPAAVSLALLAVAWFYARWRPAPNFVLTSKALSLLVAFSTVYSILMYALATAGRPLVDAQLARIDESLGLSAAAVVRWVDARPWLAWSLWAAYFSLIPQTILAIVWLGFHDRRYHLDKFLVRFMLGSLITAVGFYLWPAVGTYGGVYNLPVPAYCRDCLEHFESLRCGARTVITWRETQGLITFPSFHTIWAVLLAVAFVGTRLFWPLALLNLLVVVSTVTTGMHYFTDVFAGLLISLVVVAATRTRDTDNLTQPPAGPNKTGSA